MISNTPTSEPFRDAKRTATNMAEMAYRETFAKTFRDCYAEYMSDDLEKAEGNSEQPTPHRKPGGQTSPATASRLRRRHQPCRMIVHQYSPRIAAATRCTMLPLPSYRVTFGNTPALSTGAVMT